MATSPQTTAPTDATMTTPEAPPAAMAVTDTAPAAQSPSDALVSVLNSNPLNTLQPTLVEGAEQKEGGETPAEEESPESPREAEKTPPKKTRSGIKVPIKKRKRSAERSSTKPTRRSDRIPRQARRSGPAPAVHVNLSDEEDSPPPAKVQKESVSKKAKKRVAEKSPTISDEASSSPAKHTPMDDSDASTEGESARTTPTATITPTRRTRSQTSSQAAGEAEGDVLLSDVLTQMKRANIRQGKQPVETSVEPPVKTPVPTSSDDDLLLEGEPIDPTIALDSRFYTEAAQRRSKKWESEGWATTGERYIDEPSFEALNLVQFLRARGLYQSVVGRDSYSTRTIRDIYANIWATDFGNPFSHHFGKVYMRHAVYNLRPQDINDELGLTHVDTDLETVPDMTEVTKVITGGKETVWKSPMKAANLTYLYSALHKVMTYNWIVSRNNTIVTTSQATLLYQIGLGLPFNIGQLIFNQIATLGTRHSNLAGFPFPSLIYRILKKQGFKESLNAKAKVEVVKSYSLNATLLFSGQKVKDLPWVDPSASRQPSISPGAPITVDSTVLVDLLKKVEDMERVAQNVYNNTMGDLIMLRTALEDLISSQKGGGSPSAAAVGSHGEPTKEGTGKEGEVGGSAGSKA